MKRKISGHTRVCGLFGHPVEHSFSPAMHNAAFAHLDLDFVYVAFAVPPGELAGAVAGIRALNLAGVNVTVPHKEKVVSYLDELTTGARLSGAVNTIVHRDGRLIGYNTDGEGFVRFLVDDARFAPGGKRVLVLGAGGAARAVAVHLALAGAAQILVANRTLSRALELAGLINSQVPARAAAVPWPAGDGRHCAGRIRESETGSSGSGTEPGTSLTERPAGDTSFCPGRMAGCSFPEAAAAADLIVHTTPLGMHPRSEACPDFPFECLRPGQVVVDLVYNPPHTLFMERAARAGARIYNGLGMLLYQGALSFELWTGEKAPLEVMRRALMEVVGRRLEGG
ncbi:shikimate dehydrogenase [Desulfofundulus thermobenzoicus]|uniref:Shikimate dehydrogenase (NADP(+)) n=1 Tax=Desulfofundulus thermobenzoicus TaxID=29376 RepID=A0A6N7IUL1_9FIRM|nr:shikimate dehydrogenase [Desulfofundulus thermobenzoicus]MQL53806.1 shikimate dehydrogenase [Desulfofundulus thermobenzoicus]